jgi:RNA polymerase-binding transcription factor DksA
MSLTKRFLEEQEHDNEIESLLRYLIDEMKLSGAALGIAEQATTKGMQSLSPNQRQVINSVLEKFKIPECIRCGNDIPLSELEADDEYCSYCAHMMEKEERE